MRDDRDADNFHDAAPHIYAWADFDRILGRRRVIPKLLLPERELELARTDVDSEWEVRLYARITTGLTIRADPNDRVAPRFRLQMNLFVLHYYLDNDGEEG